MPQPLWDSPFFVAAAALGVLGVLLLLAGIAALWRARPLRFALRTLLGLLLLSLGALAGTVAIGTQGYRALTHEALAARIAVRPTGAQRFAATVRLPEGRELHYDIAGDEIYVDAHVLKWKPIANVVGLHTAYELDRLAGRYRDVEHERNAPRNDLYALAGARDRSVQLAPAPCVPRRAARRRIRLRELRPGGPAGRVRAARVDHRLAVS